LLIIASIGYLGGLTNFLPPFGINIYPHGNFLIPINSIIFTYAILKYQFLDITIVIKRSLVYSLLIAIISLTYLLIAVLSEKFLQGIVGYQSIVVSVVTAFAFGLVLIPLRNKIQYLIDRLFFKGTPMEIARQNELLRKEVAQAEKLKAVATLASGMAHEIKNPLTAIKTFSEYLPQKLEDKNFLNQFSKIAKKEVERINALVHQLMEFSRPAPLLKKQVDINQLIEETLNLLNSQMLTHRIEPVIVNQTNPHGFLTADPNRLRQAFLNLFLNAIEAMPKGGTLTITTKTKYSHRNKASRMNAKSLNPNSLTPASMEITIEDTGCGVAKEDLPHIFDPFYSKKDGGTGLGLSITHGIVEEHNGRIRVESRLGQGTRVIIEFPV
jgi:signal transduction histidine kinase